MPDTRQQVLRRLRQAVALIESCPEFAPLVPEVRTNIAYCLPGARSPADVAAVDGRITVVRTRPKAAGPVRFAASDHLARRILELRRYDSGIRAALNFRWNERLMEFMCAYCVRHGLRLGAVEREAEPRELIGQDQASMPWKVKQLVESLDGKVAPVFYETRGLGKEPLFFLVGSDPVELAERACAISRGFDQASAATSA